MSFSQGWPNFFGSQGGIMKIGIIGAGHIGGTLAELWAKNNHQITISSRHVDELTPLVKKIGSNSCNGTVEDAARFGEIIVLSIPLGGIRSTGPRIANFLVDKVVIDTMNPFIERDGDIAREIIESGFSAGEATQRRFPSARIVRAFSSVPYADLKLQANRLPPLVAIPFATDDDPARLIAVQLISEAGFEPFDLGSLKMSKPQDPGGVLFGKALNFEQVSELLGVKQ